MKNIIKGTPLPSFKILLSDSTTYLNTEDIPSDKPVALFFFGPHCPYSRALMQKIIEDINNLKEIRFYVFTIWSFNEMKDFYAHFNLGKYSNIVTGIDYTNFFSHYFDVKGVPFVIVFDKNKRLTKAFLGNIDSKQLKESVLN